jgi:hypothetical protein
MKRLGTGKPTEQSRLTTERQLQSCGLQLAVLYESTVRGIFYYRAKGKILLVALRGLRAYTSAAANIPALKSSLVAMSKTYLVSYFMTSVYCPLFSKSY